VLWRHLNWFLEWKILERHHARRQPARRIPGNRLLHGHLWRWSELSINQTQSKLDGAQKVQTSAKVSNFNQKWSGIRIQISGLIRTWIGIRMSAGSIPKRCGFITLSASVISPSVCENRPVTVCEMVINLLKSAIPQWRGKWKSKSGIGSHIPPPR